MSAADLLRVKRRATTTRADGVVGHLDPKPLATLENATAILADGELLSLVVSKEAGSAMWRPAGEKRYVRIADAIAERLASHGATGAVLRVEWGTD